MLQAVASLQYPESPTVVGVLRSFMTLAGSDRSALEAYSRLGGQSSSRKVEFVFHLFWIHLMLWFCFLLGGEAGSFGVDFT